MVTILHMHFMSNIEEHTYLEIWCFALHGVTDPRPQEAETGRSGIQDQPGKCSEAPSQVTKVWGLQVQGLGSTLCTTDPTYIYFFVFTLF